MEKKHVQFTADMRKTHTILVPDMLPIHFKLIIKVFEKYGYKMELLQTLRAQSWMRGLKTCITTLVIPRCWL